MNRPAHFFNIESADQLFDLLKIVANRLMTASEKRMEDLLLLVFGLTHLREWIALNYAGKKRKPKTPEEHFFQDIYKLDKFKQLQALCNRSKHMRATNHVMGVLHERAGGTGLDVKSASKSDGKLPAGFSVDNDDIEDVIQVVIKFYENKWFRKGRGGQRE
jgi:hypothetical protein